MSRWMLTMLVSLSACRDAPISEAKAAASEEGVDFRRSPDALKYLHLEVVKSELTRPTVSLPGRVVFDEERTQHVASPIDGRVHLVHVKLGDKVKAGDALIELSSPQVAQLLSDLQKAEQDRIVAEKALARARQLHADGAVSEKDLGQAEADSKKNVAEVQRVRAQLKALGISDSGSILATLHAEVAGAVVEKTVLPGQEVRADAAAALLTVSDLTQVWVNAELYEQDLSLVELNEAVEVKVPAWPEDIFPGKVVYVGDVVDPVTHTVKVRCSVSNSAFKLKPEMFATVRLTASTEKAALLVPSSAVLANGDRNEVVAAIGDGNFKVHSVKVGSEVDGRVQIYEGLKEGDVVVTRGALFARQEIKEP